MSPAVQEVLNAIKPAADAWMTGEIAKAPTLTAEGLTMLDTVAPKLDIPAGLVSILKGENTTIEALADPLLINELTFLQTRVDALL